MSEELKPCPFCGGAAEIHVALVAFVDCEISCTNCGVSGGNYGAMDLDHSNAPKHRAEAIAAWNTRACLLPVVKPLVAGAYEAAASKLAKAAQAEAEINNPHDAELLWHMEKRIRALTHTDAQAALDAAISKAVNEKLDEVAGVELSFPKYQSVEYQAGWESAVVEMADAILAMKEE